MATVSSGDARVSVDAELAGGPLTSFTPLSSSVLQYLLNLGKIHVCEASIEGGLLPVGEALRGRGQQKHWLAWVFLENCRGGARFPLVHSSLSLHRPPLQDSFCFLTLEPASVGLQIFPLHEMEKCRAGFPVPCSGQEPWQSIWRSCELSIQQKEPGFPSVPILTREVRERCVFCALG